MGCRLSSTNCVTGTKSISSFPHRETSTGIKCFWLQPKIKCLSSRVLAQLPIIIHQEEREKKKSGFQFSNWFQLNASCQEKSFSEWWSAAFSHCCLYTHRSDAHGSTEASQNQVLFQPEHVELQKVNRITCHWPDAGGKRTVWFKSLLDSEEDVSLLKLYISFGLIFCFMWWQHALVRLRHKNFTGLMFEEDQHLASNISLVDVNTAGKLPDIFLNKYWMVSHLQMLKLVLRRRSLARFQAQRQRKTLTSPVCLSQLQKFLFIPSPRVVDRRRR